MTSKSKRMLLVFLISLLMLLGIPFFSVIHSRPTIIHLGIHEGSSWDVPQGQDNRVLDHIIKKFERSHPGVKVVYESGIRKSDYSDWLSEKLIKGEQPDLFMVPENDFNLFATTGVLKNLDYLVANDLNSNHFYPIAYKAGQYNGNQFALPYESNPVMMCINKDLLKKSGFNIPNSNWTTDDFYKMAKATTKDRDNDGEPDQFGVVGYHWTSAMAAFGNQIFSENGRHINLNTNKTKKAMDLMSQLNSLSGSYRVSAQDFDKGNVVFRPMTMAEYRTYKPYPYHIAKYSTFEWTCVPMPSVSKSIKATQMSSSLFAISNHTKYDKLSWELLKSLTYNEKSQQELVEQSQGVSVLKSVMTSKKTEKVLQEDDFGSDSLTVSTLDKIIKDSTEPPKFKKYNHAYKEADYLISQSLGNETIETDLAYIEKKLSQSLR